MDVTLISNTPLFKGNRPLAVEGSTVYINGKAVVLGKEIGKGGEGTIFEYGENVIKIYSSASLSKRLQIKLEILSQLGIDDKRLILPKNLVKDKNDLIIGFVMRRAYGEKLEICLIYDFKPWKRIQLIDCVIKILSAISVLHNNKEHNILIGDINLNNIYISDSGDVNILDLDSIQIDEFPCPVGTPQFSSRNILGKSFDSFLRTKIDEQFAIAVLIFLLFMRNFHPYRHKKGGSIEQDIKDGIFPYKFDGTITAEAPTGYAKYCWPYLNDQMREAFVHIFDIKDKSYTVADWISLLKDYRSDIQIQVQHGLSEYNEIAVSQYPSNFNAAIISNSPIRRKIQSQNKKCVVCGNISYDKELCISHEKTVSRKKHNAEKDYAIMLDLFFDYVCAGYSADTFIRKYEEYLNKLTAVKFKGYFSSSEVSSFVDKFRKEYTILKNNINNINAINREFLIGSKIKKLKDENNIIDYNEIQTGLRNIKNRLNDLANNSKHFTYDLHQTNLYRIFEKQFSLLEKDFVNFQIVKCSKCGNEYLVNRKNIKNVNEFICSSCSVKVDYKCPVCGCFVNTIQKYELIVYEASKVICHTCNSKLISLCNSYKKRIDSFFQLCDFLNIDFEKRKDNFKYLYQQYKKDFCEYVNAGVQIDVGCDINNLKLLIDLEKDTFEYYKIALNRINGELQVGTVGILSESKNKLAKIKDNLSSGISSTKQKLNTFPIFASVSYSVSQLIQSVEKRLTRLNDQISIIEEKKNMFIKELKEVKGETIDFKERLDKKKKGEELIEELKPFSSLKRAAKCIGSLNLSLEMLECEEMVFSDVLDTVNRIAIDTNFNIDNLKTNIKLLNNIMQSLSDSKKIITISRFGVNLPYKFMYRDFLCYDNILSLIKKANDRALCILKYVDESFETSIKQNFEKINFETGEKQFSSDYFKIINKDVLVPFDLKQPIIQKLKEYDHIQSVIREMFTYIESLRVDFLDNFNRTLLDEKYGVIDDALKLGIVSKCYEKCKEQENKIILDIVEQCKEENTIHRRQLSLSLIINIFHLGILFFIISILPFSDIGVISFMFSIVCFIVLFIFPSRKFEKIGILGMWGSFICICNLVSILIDSKRFESILHSVISYYLDHPIYIVFLLVFIGLFFLFHFLDRNQKKRVMYRTLLKYLKEEK